MSHDDVVMFVPQHFAADQNFTMKADGDEKSEKSSKGTDGIAPTIISYHELSRLVNQVPLKSPLPILQSDGPALTQGQPNDMLFCSVPQFCHFILSNNEKMIDSTAEQREVNAESVLLLEAIDINLRTLKNLSGKPMTPMAALYHGSSPSTLDILLRLGFQRTVTSPGAVHPLSNDSTSSAHHDEDPLFTFFSPNVSTAAVYSNRRTFSLSAELGVPGTFTRFSVLWCGAAWKEVIMLEDAPLSMEELRLKGQRSPSEVNYADAATYWLDGATCYAIPRSRVGTLVTPLAVLRLVEWRNTTLPIR